MTRVFTAALLMLLTALPSSARSQENAGPNINIDRWARGSYVYRTLSGPEEERRLRGREHFEFMAYRDRSRKLTITQDLFARNAQFSVMLSVDAAFRPRYAFVDYWTENGHKGTSSFIVQDDELHITSTGPLGLLRGKDEAPEAFSIGTHPVSADGWHRPAHATGKDGEAALSGTAYHLEASSDLQRPIFGKWEDFRFSAPVSETITVPAGTFETMRYTINGLLTIWVTGPDHLLVRMIAERFDREYLLTRLERGTGGAMPE